MEYIEQHLEELLRMIDDADAAIMDVYDADAAVVEMKADNTPLTQADMASHEIAMAGLGRLTPEIPVVSEEGDVDANKHSVLSKLFWLYDPIDGTREFIARTGQFCVCLALVKEGKPVFGIVSAPAMNVRYYGGPEMGSFKQERRQPAQRIHVADQALGIVLGSRTELDGPTVDYIHDHYPDATIEQIGSQLKLPYIAEGRADAYPRINGPLHLWDLAPGHAILAGAGGSVTRPDGSPIDYRDQSLMAGDFLATSLSS